MYSILRARPFQNNIIYYHLLNMGYTGNLHVFTQVKGIGGFHTLYTRLDKVLANSDWCLLHHEVSVIHLPHVYSYHHTITLVCLYGQSPFLCIQPLRFETAWMLRPGDENVVIKACSLILDLINVQWKAFFSFNKEIFGNIFK